MGHSEFFATNMETSKAKITFYIFGHLWYMGNNFVAGSLYLYNHWKLIQTIMSSHNINCSLIMEPEPMFLILNWTFFEIHTPNLCTAGSFETAITPLTLVSCSVVLWTEEQED